MSPGPQHGTPAGNAILAIRSFARRSGADVQELMTLYALEGLLARIALSEYREDFVLKGGVLLAAFAARRPTKDIDLQATGLDSDPEEVAERVRAIAALGCADGLVFDPSAVTATTIRDEDEYAGVRVRLTAQLGTARLTIGMDVNFGDPIWPAPRLIDLPRVVPLGLPPVTVLGYPLTMVIAEKIITAIDRGVANTRWRDFADVHVLTRLHSVDAGELRTSMTAVAEYRGVALAPLLPALAPMSERAQQKYRAWRTRSHRDGELPEAFGDLLGAVARFADPVLSAAVAGRWNPVVATWE
ncbi:nucleotidyltransferase AbiEii toxin of type IV toxin-antitoxin system [Rathayibacter sp. PhB93]|uniref:nucleotidyl transferase AbiEii/AbiGii toxin family protein n=1 Tax=unclassified Rathayibacter TaxID=2609250 RepID=UPI000FB6121B|nr:MULTISPECIES: nucleotidyl transferase AbiEii/AbiGii toxin family protein [unclassified Rathayibacter]ROQ02120.1 nucleotidyltransferase AbiEii toxin of type IV toxin-antitoxin system [Rathayibacter sp. PhB93]TDQ07807.1 nucleotidyltransferase AbiEii toxin of type IV toxin-antitoxin system [Rathayibacter sp. PhB1]